MPTSPRPPRCACRFSSTHQNVRARRRTATSPTRSCPWSNRPPPSRSRRRISMSQTMTRSQMKAAADESLYAELPQRDLLRGLGEVIHRQVPLILIYPNPDQPRSMVDEDSPEFEDLVGSIRAQGLVQPISLWQVDENNNERFTIIAGERRWRAFRRLAGGNPHQ